jgi:glycosyltransferase involved in cell wall biosynthesis
MISIIIPTLNEVKYVGLLLSQFTTEIRKKYDLEIIVSDGGSTDGTVELVKDQVDILLLHDSKTRQTIAEGRNKGAVIAKGKILFFINADTFIKDINRFFQVISKELQNPKTIALTCQVSIFPEEETLSDKIFHTFNNYYFATLNYLGVGMGRGECHIIRRERFFEVGQYNEAIIAGEDFELFTRLARKGKIRFLHNLKIYESPRRYRRYGYLRVLAAWFRNCVYIVLFKKSVPGEWEVIR